MVINILFNYLSFCSLASPAFVTSGWTTVILYDKDVHIILLSPPLSCSLEEHLPCGLCPAGLFCSVPSPLAPLDLRRQRQLQLLLRHHLTVQCSSGMPGSLPLTANLNVSAFTPNQQMIKQRE